MSTKYIATDATNLKTTKERTMSVSGIEYKLQREKEKLERAIRILGFQIEHRKWLLAERSLRDVMDLERNITYTEEILVLLKQQEKDLPR